MSSKNKQTSIVLDINGTLKRVAILQFDDEGSIYTYFPRKKGYKVTVQENIQLPVTGNKQISISKGEYTKSTPYISFHPKKMAIHINTQATNERYKPDTAILNLGENAVTFPLCQILIPTFEYLDSYTIKKHHRPPLQIKCRPKDPCPGLHLSLWIHPKNTYLDLEDIPHSNVYKNGIIKLLGMTAFTHCGQNPYICTVIIGETEPSKIVYSAIPQTIVAVFNETQPYVFGLEPLLE